MAGALTSGIGLLAGMAYLGSTNNLEFSQSVGEKDISVVLACDTHTEAEMWTHAIGDQLHILQGVPIPNGGGGYKHVSPTVRLSEVEEWVKISKWKVFSVADGIRVFENVREDAGGGGSSSSSEASKLRPPCLRVNIGVNGSVADVFMAVMNLPASCRTGCIRSIRVVDTIDNCRDIVHIMLEPIFVYPTWTAPRDLCLMRYWKQNSDGSHVVCLDSEPHTDCPLVLGYIRAELHAAYVISPARDGDVDEDSAESLLSFIAQMDPKGWIWHNYYYQHNLLKELMLHIVDIRDALDADRFVQAHFDPVVEERRTNSAGGGFLKADDAVAGESEGTIATVPPPTLSPEVWGEIDYDSFKIRGASYLKDRCKITSAPAMFQLAAMDLYEVPEPMQHVCAKPGNRVYMASQRGDNTWTFCMNIMVPGPPHLCFVAYMTGDKAALEQDTPFGRIAKKFFFGNDDVFRNNRFKLIPKVQDGNFIIKAAVKDTPALLGNKLKQYYHRGDNYFELDVDVGSSVIAKNTVGLAIGYSKQIIVDIAVCLQGDEENELPEVLMGGCQCNHVDMGKAVKFGFK